MSSIKVLDTREEHLLSRIQSGDSVAFNELFTRYWPDLYQQARYRLSDHQEAQDMLQDIFMDIWQRRYELQINSSIQSYLRGALKFKIIRHASLGKLQKESIEHLLRQMNKVENSVSDLMTVNELSRTIDEVVSQFPENMRNIFLLRTEQYTIAEIAETLGLSPQTVKNNSTDALNRLRKVIIEKHPDVSSSFFLFLTLFTQS